MAQEVFSNSLIIHILSKFLPFPDLLVLRQVNKTLLQSVTLCKNFQERMYLRVYWNLHEENLIYPINQNLTICSPNLKIMLMFDNKNTPGYEKVSLTSKLPEIKALKLTLLLQNGSLNRSNYKEKIHSSTMTLLNGTPKLVSFAINRHLLSIIDLSKTNQETKDRIQMWKELVMYAPPTQKSTGLLDKSAAMVQNNLAFIAKSVTNLNKFVFDKFPLPSSKAAEYICTIASKCNETLVTLELVQSDVWKCNHSMFQQKMPRLKRLKLKASNESKSNVAGFLKLLPPLEVLAVRFDTFSKEVYDVVASKCTELRIFHVKAKIFEGQGKVAADWEFLRNSKYLEDLEIRIPHCRSRAIENHDYINTIAGNLNSNLRRLFLRGLPGKGIANLGGWNFPKLKELSLLRCGEKGAIDDSCLQILGSGSPETFPFKRLVTFEFSCCDNVTNDVVRNWLTRRSALTKLTIKDCFRITDRAMNRLGFPELRSLDVSSNSKVHKHGVLEAVKLNPRLQFLRTSCQMLQTEIAKIVGPGRFVRVEVVYDKHGEETQDSESDADFVLYYDSEEDRNSCYDDYSD